MKKFILSIIVIPALLLVGCASSPAISADETVDLTGSWAYSGSEYQFEAAVADGEIEIEIVLSDDSTGLYWTGTFAETAKDGDTITSEADTEALSGSLFGSLDSEKDFVFEDGTLNFAFSIAGVKTDVQLVKK